MQLSANYIKLLYDIIGILIIKKVNDCQAQFQPNQDWAIYHFRFIAKKKVIIFAILSTKNNSDK